MLRNAVALAEAGRQGIGDRVPIGIDLAALFTRPVMHELQLDGDERVLLLGAGADLENAVTRAVGAKRVHAAKSPPGPALGSFDLGLINLSGEPGPKSSAAAGAAAESLRPGGRLALIAASPHSLRLWPEVEGFQALWNSYLSGDSPSSIEATELTKLIQATSLRPLGSTLLQRCNCQDRGRFMAFTASLIAALDAARDKIQARMAMSSPDFTRRIRALQQWRESEASSFSHSACYAEGRRRMREYLTLLPGAALTYSGA